MTHDEVRGRLGPYLGGELPATAQIRLERHLAECRECTTELEELRATVTLLRALPEPTSPPGLIDAVMTRVRDGEARPRGVGPVAAWFRRLVEGPLPIPVALVGAGLCLVAIVRSVEISIEPWPASTEPSLGLQAQAPLTPVARVPLRRVASSEVPTPSRFMTEPRLDPGLVGSSTARDPVGIRLPDSQMLTHCREISAGQANGARVSCVLWFQEMLAMADTPGFLIRIDSLPQQEREAWISQLVDFATISSVASDVAARLRALRDPRAVSLALRFEGLQQTALPR